MSQNVHPIILYDGVCGLCNRFVGFVLKRDPRDQFRFAALQGPFSRVILERHGTNPDALDTVYLVLDCQLPGERLLSRSDAAIAVVARLGRGWRLGSRLLALFPRAARDWAYNIVAGSRYRYFGKYQSCPLPRPEDRHRFLDLLSPEGGPSQ